MRIKAETIIVIDKMLDWFSVNKINANNDKFQYILFSRNGLRNDEYARVGSCEVKAESCVKLLGVHFDQQLSFSAHMHIDELY